MIPFKAKEKAAPAPKGPMRWKNPQRIRAWLYSAAIRWGRPVRVFVCGKLMAENIEA